MLPGIRIGLADEDAAGLGANDGRGTESDDSGLSCSDLERLRTPSETGRDLSERLAALKGIQVRIDLQVVER